MKNAMLFHGTGEGPDSFWFPYIKRELEQKGYAVWVPLLPDTEKPELKSWLPFVLDHGGITEETVLIGHSSGCPLILSVLESIPVVIKQAILVAGFFENLPSGGFEPILQEQYDWEKIKQHANEFVFINSDNDPWGCDDKAGRALFDKLGGTQIIRHDGHFGSNLYNQPYKEFPLLMKLIE